MKRFLRREAGGGALGGPGAEGGGGGAPGRRRGAGMALFQPIGQKLLTNVAVVRLKRGGKRFEVACYKNKVLAWRSGAEADLGEVLQADDVFTNVVKGQFAKAGDMQKAFGTRDREEVAREILAKGELQVSPEERQHELGALLRDVANVLAEKCVNPETGLPHPASLLERALQNAHFQPDTRRSAKRQALETALPRLQEALPIERARMRLRARAPAGAAGAGSLPEALRALGADLERTSGGGAAGAPSPAAAEGARQGGPFEAVFTLPPVRFREADALVRAKGGQVEVVCLAVHRELEGGGVEQMQRRVEQVTLEARGPGGGGEAPERAGPGRGAGAGADGGPPGGAGGGARKKALRCNTCRVDFPGAAEHRAHFRSDLHRANLKRRAEGLEPLTEDLLAVPL